METIVRKMLHRMAFSVLQRIILVSFDDVANARNGPDTDFVYVAWQWFTINYTPGTNLIEVEGKSKIDANVEYRGSDTPAWRTGEDAWYKASWKLGLEITSIEGGGITIKVQHAKDNGFTIDKGRDGSSLKGTIIPYYLDKQVGTLHNDLKSALDSGISWARSSLQDALKDQGRLFLPGNGALIFKNATFNENGDLLVEVKFDGTDL
jgi:hypothetical protein